jgi:PAS domain S-box-containing protein
LNWSLSLRNIGGYLRSNLKLSHKGIILVSVPLFFELMFLGVLASLLNQAEHQAARLEHSRSIIRHCNHLIQLMYDSGATIFGMTLSGEQSFSDKYGVLMTEIPAEFKKLDELVLGDADRRSRLAQAKAVADRLIVLLDGYKQSLDGGQRLALLVNGKAKLKEMKSLIDELIKFMQDFVLPDLNRQEVDSARELETRQLVKGFLLIGIFFNVLLAFTAAVFFSKSVANRLSSVTENTRRLARGMELKPPIPGSDEIATLDRVFHAMAGQLIEASRKERAVIENAVDVICSIDAEGKFLAVSPASFKLWGYQPAELIGYSYTELIEPHDLDDSISKFKAIRLGLSSASVENRTIRKDRTVVNVIWSAYWSDVERSMFCVVHDITGRKHAEDALKASEGRVRQIIDAMPVGLLVVDERGQIESINPRTEQLFGYNSEELIGQHLMLLFPHSHDEKPESFARQIFEKALGHVEEREAVKSNGELFPTELSLTRFETLDGNRFLANVLDLTERREVERLKREFVSTVSHELRTPLTAIRGSLTLITAGAVGELSEQLRKVVTIAERNTIRLISLINDLLDLDKLEAGKLDMHFDRFPLSSVIERSVESVRGFGDQHGVTIEADNTAAQVYADGDRLVQVVVNLLSNAVKFSSKGSAVQVRVKEEQDSVQIQVIDHGRGIPERYKNLLFQRFQQVEVADSKRRGGTGLGLAICKSIVEQHKGTIGVESEEGKGSTFWFRIPTTDNSKEQRA